jgi:hypothetical protein
MRGTYSNGFMGPWVIAPVGGVYDDRESCEKWAKTTTVTEPTYTVTWSRMCLPDTIDPRGPKGK